MYEACDGIAEVTVCFTVVYRRDPMASMSLFVNQLSKLVKIFFSSFSII